MHSVEAEEMKCQTKRLANRVIDQRGVWIRDEASPRAEPGGGDLTYRRQK